MSEHKRGERVAQIMVMARAICAGMRDKDGQQPHNCWCKGDERHCNAVTLYSDFAMHALLGLERAGYSVRLAEQPAEILAEAIEREIMAIVRSTVEPGSTT